MHAPRGEPRASQAHGGLENPSRARRRRSMGGRRPPCWHRSRRRQLAGAQWTYVFGDEPRRGPAVSRNAWSVLVRGVARSSPLEASTGLARLLARGTVSQLRVTLASAPTPGRASAQDRTVRSSLASRRVAKRPQMGRDIRHRRPEVARNRIRDRWINGILQGNGPPSGPASTPTTTQSGPLRTLALTVTAPSRLGLEGTADGRYVRDACEPCELSNFRPVSGRCQSRIAR